MMYRLIQNLFEDLLLHLCCKLPLSAELKDSNRQLPAVPLPPHILAPGADSGIANVLDEVMDSIGLKVKMFANDTAWKKYLQNLKSYSYQINQYFDSPSSPKIKFLKSSISGFKRN